mgnify:CR=1 FL=1
MATPSPLGTAGAGVIASIDDGARLHVLGHPWTVEWWVGAEDRWHRPSQSASLRQSLVEASPIVESRVRVPGGDIIHRAFAFQGGDRPLVATEIENDSAVPVVLAIVVTGAAEVHVDGAVVAIDGRPALAFPAPPSQAAADVDVLTAITDGRATNVDGAVLVPNPDRDRQVALLFPLTHTAVHGMVAVDGGDLPASVPTAAVVGTGWTVQTDRGMRVATPDEAWGQGFEACRRRLLLGLDAGDLLAGASPGSVVDETPGDGPAVDGTARARLIGALGLAGMPGEARELLLAALADHDQRTGALVVPPSDARGGTAGGDTAALAWALAQHLELAPDAEFRDAVLPILAGALQYAADRRRGGLRSSAGERGLVDGDLVSSVWALAAFRDAARVLEAAGETTAAATARRFLDQLGDRVKDRLAGDEAARMLATDVLDLIPDSPSSPTSVERVAGRIAAAGPLWTWDGMPPTSSAADLVVAVRRVLVGEHRHGIDLVPGFPETWLGQAVEVHDAPTRLGTVSFALRWHGTRPALLWECEPHEAGVAIELRAPSLDPAWSSTETVGEALLADRPGPAPGDSFS